MRFEMGGYAVIAIAMHPSDLGRVVRTKITTGKNKFGYFWLIEDGLPFIGDPIETTPGTWLRTWANDMHCPEWFLRPFKPGEPTIKSRDGVQRAISELNGVAT